MKLFPLRTVAGFSLALGLALGLQTTASNAENTKVTIALPTTALTFAYAYIAHDKGYWSEQGLDVDIPMIVGLNATNAMLAGRVEFSAGSGGTFLTARARGQKLELIASLTETMAIDLVFSKEEAQKSGLTMDSPLKDRAQALKGKTIAVDAVNSLLHGTLRYVLRQGGVDPEKDVTVTPVAVPAMPSSLASKKIDGFVMGPPWTSKAVLDGNGVIWASGFRGKDLPQLRPIVATTLTAREGYCEEHKDICTKIGAGVNKALDLINQKPDEALEVLRARFKDMDPVLLETAWKEGLSTWAKRPVITEEALAHTQDFALGAGLIKPEEAVKSFKGYYNNDFVK